MGPRELMIGDWVQIPKLKQDLGDGDSFNGFTQVTRLEKDELWTDALKEIPYDGIRPIPIIDRLLDKIGFKLSYGFWRLNLEDRDENWTIEVYVRLPGPTHYLTIEHYLNDCSKGGVDCLKISYIHDLQHAFKLCGITKEIILPYEILD